MNVKELIQAEIDKIPEQELDNLYQWIKEFTDKINSVQNSDTLETPEKQLTNSYPYHDEDVQLLKSAVGMDYRTLQNYLQAGKWKEADEETARVMVAVAKREKEGWLDTNSIDNFPCEDLRTIDQLWVKYSNGKFGFSVQKRIYQGLGGTRRLHDWKIWEKFGDNVGWRKEGEWLDFNLINFSIKSPEGNLPALSFSGYFEPDLITPTNDWLFVWDGEVILSHPGL